MWILDAKLTDPGNPAPTPGDSFGFSVALSNDGHEALVGADQGGPTGQAPNGPGFADVYVQHGGVWPATWIHLRFETSTTTASL